VEKERARPEVEVKASIVGFHYAWNTDIICSSPKDEGLIVKRRDTGLEWLPTPDTGTGEYNL
jgi:hypothetical protein